VVCKVDFVLSELVLWVVVGCELVGILYLGGM